MTHIHVNKELTDDLESQGYHLVDKHQLARMQQLEKVARAAQKLHSKFAMGCPGYEEIYANPPEEMAELHKALVGLGATK